MTKLYKDAITELKKNKNTNSIITAVMIDDTFHRDILRSLGFISLGYKKQAGVELIVFGYRL